MFTNNLLGTFIVHADAQEAFQYGSKDPATLYHDWSNNLHRDDIMFSIIPIMVL